MTWNSTLSRSKPLQAKTPMKRGKPLAGQAPKKKSPGLAQRVAELAGTAIKHLRGESNLLRSEAHRRNVAALPCVNCGVQGRSQAAHANFGKGLALKACDSQLMALCDVCHRLHDSGGIFDNKQQRWAREVVLVDLTRAELISRSLWTPEIEAAYRRSYEPMKRAMT